MESSNLSFSLERAKKRTRRIKWSAVTGLVSSGAVALVSIFSAPITINYLGKELYGIWVIITSFLIWAQLFDFGILNGLTNALSEAFGRDDFDSAQKYICTSFIMTALISCLGIIPWIAMSLNVPWQNFIKVNTIEQGCLLGKGICIVGCFFLVTLPFILFQRILHAYQKLYIAHIVNFIAYLLMLLALIVGVSYRFDLLKLLLIVSAFPFIWHVFCCFFLMKKVVWTRFSWKFVNFQALKRVSLSSFPILIAQIINIITSQMLPILLASVTTLKEVADFSILWKIYVFIFFMMANVSAAYNPGIREAYERGELDWINKSLKRLCVFLTCLIIIGCIPLLFVGNQIIEFWIRMPLEQPLEVSGWCMYSLCILFGVLNCTINGVLVILDKMILQIILALLSSIALLFGILWGVPKVGLIIIFAVMSLTAFVSFFYSSKALKRLLKTKKSSLVKEAINHE